jgi:hypothetical protein
MKARDFRLNKLKKANKLIFGAKNLNIMSSLRLIDMVADKFRPVKGHPASLLVVPHLVHLKKVIVE